MEIFYAGRWGAICDDDFDIGDATVACRQLGFERGAVSFTTDSHFGRLSGKNFFDGLLKLLTFFNIQYFSKLTWTFVNGLLKKAVFE